MVPEKPLKSAGKKMPGVSLRFILNQDIPGILRLYDI
jgi:hypothetical protein